MLAGIRDRFSNAQVRPDDFKEAGGHVLMVVCFHEGDPAAPPRDERQSWIAAMSETGLVRRVISYPSPADAARALEGLAAGAPNVHV